MSLTARDIAEDMVAHLGEETALDGDLPTGCRAFMVRIINRSLEKMRAKCPAAFRQTVGLTFTGASTGTVNATSGESEVTMGTLEEPDDGCSISLAGDLTINEIRASATQDGTFILLHPFTGTTGEVSATAYGDAILLDESVDKVLGATLLHERRKLKVVTSRDELLRYASNVYPVRDYGFGGGSSVVSRQTGIPQALWVEQFTDPEDSRIKYRARCAPLPDATYRATLDILPVIREITEDDLEDGADVSLPVPGQRQHTIFRALCLYAWSGSPWFKNDSARKVIAEEYADALRQLESFSHEDASSPQIVVRY